MNSAKIVGLGKYVPPKVLTNADLEKMVDTSDEWISTRTGIKERHIVKKGEATSDLAYEAAKQALKHSQIKAKNLDLIIVATITPDTQFPSTACYLQSYLGAKNAACFDISAACAGFPYALAMAWQFLKSGFYRNTLVIGAEVLTSITDWEDRSTCVLFGDGAGAAVLVPCRAKTGILNCYLGGDGSLGDMLILPAGGSRRPATQETIKKRLHYIKMRGNEVFKIAVRIMVDTAKKTLAGCDLTTKDIDLLVPHQANSRIINAVAKRLDLSSQQVFVNIDRYGNMSSASSAIALCEAYEEGRIKKGNIVVLDAFGGGIVWGGCAIKWA